MFKWPARHKLAEFADRFGRNRVSCSMEISMKTMFYALSAVVLFSYGALCAFSIPLKSDENVDANHSLLKFRLKDRVASLSTDATGSAFSDFPPVTSWHLAQITDVQISPNPKSVVVDDDLVKGIFVIHNSQLGARKKQQFEIQFDSGNFPPASLGGFESGMCMYIGLTTKNQLFDVYYPARESRKAG